MLRTVPIREKNAAQLDGLISTIMIFFIRVSLSLDYH